MNHQLLEKVISLNLEQCPKFVFANPLLDRNVASALSRSYIKFLRQSDQNVSTNKMRLTVLTNIKKMCKVNLENHLHIDDNFTSLLSECYMEHINEVSYPTNINRTLDAFLIRKLKDINSNYEKIVNPEVIQALININETDKLQNWSNSVICWNVSNKHLKVLKELWLTGDDSNIVNLSNDISIKIKSEIESLILDSCLSLLANRSVDLKSMFLSNEIKVLLKKSSISAQCFQICYNIINYLFIITNYDYRMQLFVSMFIKNIKLQCVLKSFSVLYSNSLTHLVVLLDFDIDVLPELLKNKYIENTLHYLHRLHEKSESDLILILSHFPNWFDIYFKNN